LSRAALSSAGVKFRTEARPGRATIRIGDAEIPVPDARGATREEGKAAEQKFQAMLRAALLAAGYPERASPSEFDIIGMIAVVGIFIVAATAMYGPLAAFLVELFPAEVRYTALSFPYHVGSGWFGGLMPAIAFAIMTATGDMYAGLWYPFTVTLVALLIMLFLVPETRGRAIDG
jgi:hypothetical protein